MRRPRGREPSGLLSRAEWPYSGGLLPVMLLKGQLGVALDGSHHRTRVLLLTVGLMAGAAVGAITMAFLAVAAYGRGYADASRERDQWRSELAARRHHLRSMVRSAA